LFLYAHGFPPFHLRLMQRSLFNGARGHWSHGDNPYEEHGGLEGGFRCCRSRAGRQYPVGGDLWQRSYRLRAGPGSFQVNWKAGMSVYFDNGWMLRTLVYIIHYTSPDHLPCDHLRCRLLCTTDHGWNGAAEMTHLLIPSEDNTVILCWRTMASHLIETTVYKIWKHR